jgi:hypothetical protein
MRIDTIPIQEKSILFPRWVHLQQTPQLPRQVLKPSHTLHQSPLNKKRLELVQV